MSQTFVNEWQVSSLFFLSSHIVLKQYRKIKMSEIHNIIKELGIEESTTINSLMALLKFG